MRYRRIGLPAAMILLGIAQGASAVAGGGNVEKCLATPYYPDEQKAYEACSVAIADPTLIKAERAKVSLQLGQAFYFAHNPGKAIPYFDAAIKDDPNLVEAYLRRGWANVRVNHLESAIGDLTEVLDRQPDNPDALYALATINQDESPEGCRKKAARLEDILRRHPDHYRSRVELALTYSCADGNDVRNLAELKKALAAGPDILKPYTYYGDRAPQTFDFYGYVRSQVMNADIGLKDYDAALAEANWLVEHYPGELEIRHTRSGLNYSLSDLAGALADNEKVLEVVPDYADAAGLHVKILVRLKRYDEVVKFSERWTQPAFATEATPVMLYFRAAALKVNGRKQEAIVALNAAMALDSYQVWAVYNKLQERGYVSGPPQFIDRDPVPDYHSKEFTNAVEACMADPECLTQ